VDQKCEVCGEPATVQMCDVIVTGSVKDANGVEWETAEPGDMHYFCQAHERDSHFHLPDGTVWKRAPFGNPMMPPVRVA